MIPGLPEYSLVMASCVFNFLAERTLETLGEGHRVHVIHTRKTQEFAHGMRKTQAVAFEQLAGRQTTHWQMLEAVLAGRWLTHLVTKPLVVFLDHDMGWNSGAFDELLIRFLVPFADDRTLIAWPDDPVNHDGRGFATCPMLAVRRSPYTSRAGCWDPAPPAGGDYRLPWADTGQRLAEDLRAADEQAVVSVQLDTEACGRHLGSKWMTRQTVEARGGGTPEHLAGPLERRMCRMLEEGGFMPSAEEQGVMRAKYGAFGMWLDKHAS